MPTDQIAELHDRLLKTLRDRRFCRADPLESPTIRNRVADNPSKSYVLDAIGQRNGVLILSNSVSPDLVARSVAKAREARQELGETLGSVILEPIRENVFEGCSYALWPLQRALSTSRIPRFVQKACIRRRVLHWLEAATTRTVRSDLAPERVRSLYVDPLTRILDDVRFSDGLRSASSHALSDLDSGALTPLTVLQHSDLWLGNVLLPLRRNTRSLNPHGFFIIDWGGATLTGHPFLDLLRFSMSSRLSRVRLRSELAAHCRILACTSEHAVSYTVAALGVIGMNLEHFPEGRYRTMCERVLEAADASRSR